jgi:hypothetical protein
MYSDKCLELFQRPRDKNAPPRDGTFEPLFVRSLRKRSEHHNFLVYKFSTYTIYACACWGAKSRAGKEPLEDADGHQCVCQRRVRVGAKKKIKKQQNKPKNKKTKKETKKPRKQKKNEITKHK